MPPDLERQFGHCRRIYWDARQKYSTHLLRNDPDLWRLLMPCDPVITVADDVLFFECFSADESSYGCLTVNREFAFGKSADTRCGTTMINASDTDIRTTPTRDVVSVRSWLQRAANPVANGRPSTPAFLPIQRGERGGSAAPDCPPANQPCAQKASRASFVAFRQQLVVALRPSLQR